jgi:hypothetical protein
VTYKDSAADVAHLPHIPKTELEDGQHKNDNDQDLLMSCHPLETSRGSGTKGPCRKPRRQICLEDAEGFCAKAASEGTIQAEIDHTAQCLVAVSREGDAGDTLSERIHRDIKDCFAVREDAQRATHKEKVVED